MTQKMILVLTNCSDSTRLEEFDRWYTDVHVPDVMAVDGVVRGTRYRLAGEPRQGQAQFLVHYEIETDDDWRTLNGRLMEQMARVREAGRVLDILQAVTLGFYEQVSDTGAAGPGSAPWERFYLVLTNCSDPARVEEFDRWYEDVHVPDVLETPGLVRARRYRLATRPREGQSQFLAFYQAGDDSQERIAEGLAATRERTQREGRRIDCLDVVTSGFYELVSDRVKG